jgi:DNA-binding response OmpR family regulator
MVVHHGVSARFLLLIDEDPEVRELVTSALALEGYAVRTARDASAGLQSATDETAVVLLDLTRRAGEAREFARRYRERCGHIAPIIVFTAHHRAQELAAAIEAQGVFPKPFDLDDLVRLAARHLGDATSPRDS